MKVLILARSKPSKQYPLNGCFEYQQANALVHEISDIEVSYMYVDLRSIRRKRKFGIRCYSGGDNIDEIAIDIPLGRLPKRLINYFYCLFVKIGFRKYKKKYGEPDIVHSHFLVMGYAAAKNKKIFPNAKFIVTEHSSSILNDFDARNIEIERVSYDGADCIIAVSPIVADIVKKISKTDTYVIPNMVDSNLFNIRTKKSNHEVFHFLSVGNLIERKNFKGGINAFCDAFTAEDKVNYTIIGDGVEKKTLLELIEKNGRSHQIRLVGLQPKEVVKNYMSNSDCLVLCSKKETFGVVLIEALMSGLPVIATKCGGPDGIVSETNGYLVPVNDNEKLLLAMKNMKMNNKFSNSKIRNDAIDKFSEHNVSMKIKEIYEKVLQE